MKTSPKTTWESPLYPGGRDAAILAVFFARKRSEKRKPYNKKNIKKKSIQQCSLHSLYIFLIIVYAFLVLSCKDGFRLVKEDLREEPATIHLVNFQRESRDIHGHRKWSVKAKEAFVYMKDKVQTRIIAYDFEFMEYEDSGAIRNLVSAHRGEIRNLEKMMYLKGKVHSKNSAGRVVEAEELAYDMEDKFFTTTKPVTIIDKSIRLYCKRGAEIDVANNRQICKGTTVFKKNDPGQKEDTPSTDFDIFQ